MPPRGCGFFTLGGGRFCRCRIRSCDKASFCVIAADAVRPREFTTYFRSVIAFGRIGIVDSDAERLHAARLLGEKYNPGDEAGLTDELARGLQRMAVLRLDVEHLSGKEAIEIVRSRQHG